MEEEKMIFKQWSEKVRFFRILKNLRLVVALLAVGAAPVSAGAFDIYLGTGQVGSFSHFVGRTLCRAINVEADNLNCKTIPTADGDVHNLTNLTGGSLDICIVDSRMLQDAVEKEGSFEFLDIVYDNLRLMVPLYDIPISLVVRQDAGIENLDALEGKRINVGAPLTAEKRAMSTILAVKNWTKESFSVVQELPSSQSQDTMAFCHGAIQAMVHIGVHPDSSLTQLLQLCNADIVGVYDADIESFIHGNPAFTKTMVPQGAYPSISSDITTLGTRGVLVASDSLDEDTAYRVLEAIYKKRKRLNRAHPALSPPSGEQAPSQTGVQLHGGAVKFFPTQ
jgi:TRAP transporter TAXI family solute receptor